MCLHQKMPWRWTDQCPRDGSREAQAYCVLQRTVRIRAPWEGYISVSDPRFSSKSSRISNFLAVLSVITLPILWPP